MGTRFRTRLMLIEIIGVYLTSGKVGNPRAMISEIDFKNKILRRLHCRLRSDAPCFGALTQKTPGDFDVKTYGISCLHLERNSINIYKSKTCLRETF